MFQAEGRGGAKLPRQELVDYVQRAEKSLEPGAESEKMKPGRWAGGPSPKGLARYPKGFGFSSKQHVQAMECFKQRSSTIRFWFLRDFSGDYMNN